jgi:hypothetical protein
MDREEYINSRIIKALRKKHDLESIIDLELDLNEFRIIKSGENYRYLDTWKVNRAFHNVYLCSYIDSFETEQMNNNFFFQKYHYTERYHAIFIESKIELPDLIVRPSLLADKFSNPFLKYDMKLIDRPIFNSQYVVESKASKQDCESFLTQNLTSLMEEEKNFFLEVKNSKVLCIYEQEMEMNNTFNLLSIAKEIDEILKT